MAQDNGVLQAELREHAVTEDGDAGFCNCKSADAAIFFVDDVKRAQRLGSAVVSAHLLLAVSVCGVNLISFRQRLERQAQQTK